MILTAKRLDCKIRFVCEVVEFPTVLTVASVVWLLRLTRVPRMKLAAWRQLWSIKVAHAGCLQLVVGNDLTQLLAHITRNLLGHLPNVVGMLRATNG